MSNAKPITIIGGGLAGLALGVGLRRQHIPTTVLEAGHYPRHRVCGEFISGRGQATLTRLGLTNLFDQAGARPARTVALFSSKSRSGVRHLPSPALCLSRYHMDMAIAEEFVRLGGRLQLGNAWRDGLAGEGLVGAIGRVRADSEGKRRSWFGLKAHFHGLRLEADLELHLGCAGYIGLCRLDENEVNVCGLFKGHFQRERCPGGKLGRLLQFAGPKLGQRLRQARMDESSFCSVAGLGYGERQCLDTEACAIGDCLTLIPPFAGNGMSMAFEAAELAVEPLTRYGLSRINWMEAVQSIRVACHQRFERRLAWSRALHRLMFHPAAQRGLAPLIFRFDCVWRWIFALTR